MAERTRKLWLDWQRGLAVLYMVQWHTYDSWRADAVAAGPVHAFLGHVGGFAAPSFLYMAGMSQLLGDGALERKGVPAGERRARAVRRALWLLAVAYAFRAFEFVAGGAFLAPGGWRTIFRVDVLNVIAVSLLAAAVLTVGWRPRVHVLLAGGAALAVALLTPVVAGWITGGSGVTGIATRLLDYLYTPDASRGIFWLFPWAAFALAGSAFGRLAQREQQPFVWIGLGAALFAGGWAAEAWGPTLYAHRDFWVTSPQWLAMRLGGVVATSGALQLLPQSADRWLAWLRTMGRHSMLGYFVSIELPYGVLSRVFHKRLSTTGAVLGVLAMIAVTWALSAGADRYDAWKAERARRAAAPEAAPTA
ncbi:MAG TPA: heparan-alpha-glucosaminide N-acetyltransferase domain-containing protein [Anaeromyxobacter sp.]|nr:heparan-alpha-glucosaminide N-acetyltransferase domain-containing protein [Anaeromyxobacter sp.]